MYEGRETRKQLCDMYVCLMMAFCAKQDSDPTKGAKTKINVQKCVYDRRMQKLPQHWALTMMQ